MQDRVTIALGIGAGATLAYILYLQKCHAADVNKLNRLANEISQLRKALDTHVSTKAQRPELDDVQETPVTEDVLEEREPMDSNNLIGSVTPCIIRSYSQTEVPPAPIAITPSSSAGEPTGPSPEPSFKPSLDPMLDPEERQRISSVASQLLQCLGSPDGPALLLSPPTLPLQLLSTPSGPSGKSQSRLIGCTMHWPRARTPRTPRSPLSSASPHMRIEQAHERALYRASRDTSRKSANSLPTRGQAARATNRGSGCGSHRPCRSLVFPPPDWKPAWRPQGRASVHGRTLGERLQLTLGCRTTGSGRMYPRMEAADSTSKTMC